MTDDEARDLKRIANALEVIAENWPRVLPAAPKEASLEALTTVMLAERLRCIEIIKDAIAGGFFPLVERVIERIESGEAP